MKEPLTSNSGYGLVSVIMPYYNSGRFVLDAVNSVLKQVYSNFELIIIDDCAKEDIKEILKGIKDDRIKIITNETNCGAAKSRNKGIEKAQGKWLAFLDSDDLWDERKLQLSLEYMVKNNVAFSCTDYFVIDEDGKVKTTYSPKKDVYSYKNILKHNRIGCSTVICNKEIVGSVYFPEQAEKREDFACWLNILKKGIDVHCVHIPLSSYRTGNESVSSSKLKMVKYQWKVYRKVEKKNWFASVYYLMHWAIKGVFKYR